MYAPDKVEGLSSLTAKSVAFALMQRSAVAEGFIYLSVGWVPNIRFCFGFCFFMHSHTIAARI